MTVVFVHAEWWACQIGELELQVDAMIDLHRHKMRIKQATKKELGNHQPTYPRTTAAVVQHPWQTDCNDDCNCHVIILVRLKLPITDIITTKGIS